MQTEEILQRLEVGSFTNWRPTPRQEDFLQVPYDIFEVLYGGALGGGKSEVGLVLPLTCQTIESKIQLFQHPEFIGIIFRRTFQQLEKSLIPRAKIMYEAVGAEYNETKRIFKFPDRHGIPEAGGKIFLSHMENEKDVLNYDTDEYNYVFIDQAEQFTEFQLRYISSRVRRSNPDLPAIYRLSANPGGVSHTYLRKRYVEPAPEGNTLLKDKVTGTSRLFIPAKLEDNPHLEENDPNYRNRLELLPESERKAKIDGDWFTFTGQMFGEFREVHIPGELENALHVCQPFVIPTFWPRLLAGDWGYKAKTFFIWGAISPEKRLYIYRCHSWVGKTVRVWASDVRLLTGEERIVRNPLDPSAWQERGHEMTIAQEYEQYSGFVPEKADNDRPQGVQAIHEFLRWVPRNLIPTAEGYSQDKAVYILRTQGVKGHSEYLKLFEEQKPETNLPLLQIFAPSPFTGTEELISTIPLVQYHDKHKEDYAEFDGDDPIDCLRYLLKAAKVYIEEVLAKTKYFEQEADIVRELASSGNMTKYYMQMQYLESKKKSLSPKPVRRFH